MKFNKWTLALAAVAMAFTGCNTTTFSATKPDGTKVTVTNMRVIWKTEAYAASITTNGASLTANGSAPDPATIQAIAQGVAQGIASAPK